MPGYLQVYSHLLYAVNNKVLENMIFMIIFAYILQIRHLNFGVAKSDWDCSLQTRHASCISENM